MGSQQRPPLEVPGQGPGGRPDLVLPEHMAQKYAPMPTCPLCRAAIQQGEILANIAAGVRPGHLQMAPVHMTCAFAAAKAIAEAACSTCGRPGLEHGNDGTCPEPVDREQ